MEVTNTELREKLVGLLMQCDMDSDIDNDGVICDGCGRRPLSEACVAIADHLIANGVTLTKDTDVPNKWISVEERLPTKEDAKIMDGYLPAIQKGEKPNIWKWTEVAKHTEWFTHWMPLPEPPKEER